MISAMTREEGEGVGRERKGEGGREGRRKGEREEEREKEKENTNNNTGNKNDPGRSRAKMKS